ncbi:MAG: purine-nucleoside phosphorylase [Propionibacteriaceae bacterium]
MPTPHISAERGQIAPLVLMPGDPKRARRMADDLLDGVQHVSDVRGIGCYTGTYKGTPMSVMASGMGIPSISIYSTELFRFYDVARIIRVGTCGAFSKDCKIKDVIIGSSAHTDSSIALEVPGMHLSFAPSYSLLNGAVQAAHAMNKNVHVGAVLSSDIFYSNRTEATTMLADYGTLGVEMEAAGLYLAAMREHKEALVCLTVSDHLTDAENNVDLTAAERETMYSDTAQIAAEALLAR